MTDLLGQLDIGFVFDTTGSMQWYIDDARRRAREEAERVAKVGDLDLRYAVVEYRDHPPQDSSFAALVHDFTADPMQFQGYLASMGAKGGGDHPESVWDGLVAMGNLAWRPNADRIVYLLGDAPPHGYGSPGDTWADGCPCGLESGGIAELYSFHHIRLYAVSLAGDELTTKAFTEIAELCGGNCVVVKGRTAAETATHMSDHIAHTHTATSGTINLARTVAHSYSALGASASVEDVATHVHSMTGMSVDSATIGGVKAYMAARGIDPVTGEATSEDTVPPPLSSTSTWWRNPKTGWWLNPMTGKYEMKP